MKGAMETSQEEKSQKDSKEQENENGGEQRKVD